LKNKEGYELTSSWKEDDNFIYQIWNHVKLKSDYSGKFLVDIRNMNYSIDTIMKTVEKMEKDNAKTIKKLLNSDPIIKTIFNRLKKRYPNTDPFIYFIENVKNVEEFLKEIDVINVINENGYEVKGDEMLYVSTKKIIPSYLYIKFNLNKLYHLNNFSTIENDTYLKMAYLYCYTCFDEFLLKVIRYITLIDNYNLMEKDKIAFSEVLECDTIDDVLEKMINVNVEKLAWGSYKEKLEYFQRHGIKFSLDEKIYYDSIVYIAEKRNAFIHNEGIFNESNFVKIKSTCFEKEINVGEQIELTLDVLSNDVNLLLKDAYDLYTVIHTKYNLATIWKPDKLED
jgi:hypothetical protein